MSEFFCPFSLYLGGEEVHGDPLVDVVVGLESWGPVLLVQLQGLGWLAVPSDASQVFSTKVTFAFIPFF